MVLTYLTYATGVFHVTWATRSPFFALTLFFLLHVPLFWQLWGTGGLSEFEYFSLYPLVACAAALLGVVFSSRMCGGGGRALLDYFAPRAADCSHYAQWRHVFVSALLVALLIVAPALALELYTSNTVVGGVVSVLSAALVHIVLWAYVKRRYCGAPSCADGGGGESLSARRAFALCCFIIDVFVLRGAYTTANAVWPDFRFTAWPLYTILIELGVALVPALLALEYFCARRRCGVAPPSCEAPPMPRCAASVPRCAHVPRCAQPCLAPAPALAPCSPMAAHGPHAGNHAHLHTQAPTPTYTQMYSNTFATVAMPGIVYMGAEAGGGAAPPLALNI